MAWIDLTPTTFSQAASAWSNLNYMVGSDNLYATCVSGSTSKCYLTFGSNAIPKDSIITGIEVYVECKVSSSMVSYIAANYFVDASLTELASAQKTTGLSTTDVIRTIGSSTNNWGYPIRWADINENPYFGISLQVSGATTYTTLIDDVTLRVHYSQPGYLVGNRSNFSNQYGSSYDVDMVNGIANDATSHIVRKYNGASIENQVKSEDVNLLGDALYNIETAIISSTGFVFSYDLQKTYVLSMTITGYCSNTSGPWR